MNRRSISPHPSDDDLSAHADSALDAGTARQVDEHVGQCDACSARVREFRAVGPALRGSPVDAVDDLTRKRLIGAAVRGASAQPTRTPANRSRLLAAAAVAVVAVGTVAGFRAISDGRQDNVASYDLKAATGLPIGVDQITVVDASLDDLDTLSSALTSTEGGTSEVASLPQTGGGSGGGPAGGAATGGGSGGFTSDGEAEAAEGDAVNDADASGAEPAPAVGGSTEAGKATPSQTPLPPSRGGADDETIAAVARCYETIKDSVAGGQRLTAALTGIYQSKAVVVLGFRSADNRVLAMVLARDDCSILGAHSFG